MLRIRDVYHGSRIQIFPSWTDPGSKVKKNPDPGSESKNLSIFNPKNGFQALGSGSLFYTHPGSRFPDPNPQQCPKPSNMNTKLFKTVFQIRNILIRTRIRGSITLDDGFGTGSCFFSGGLHDSLILNVGN